MAFKKQFENRVWSKKILCLRSKKIIKDENDIFTNFDVIVEKAGEATSSKMELVENEDTVK